jgi:hypothetical protein
MPEQENAHQNLTCSDQGYDEYREGTENAIDEKFVKIHRMVTIAQIGLGIFDDREYIKNSSQYKDNPPGDLSDFGPFVADKNHQECNGMGDDIG